MEMDKNSLKTLLAEGKADQVIEALKSLLPRLDDDLEKEVLLQSGRFGYYLSQKRQGTTAIEQEITLAKINLAIFEVINKIPDEILVDAETHQPLVHSKGGKPYGYIGPAENVSAKSYAWVSLIAFLLSAVLMALFAVFGQEIIGTTTEDWLYYIILIPCALAVAAFLFGFMRSYATLSGRMFDRKVELGGPIVGALLVVVGGFYLTGESDFDITVRLTGSSVEEAIKSAVDAGNKVKISMDRGTGGTVESELMSNGYVIFPKVTTGKATFKIIGAPELALVDPEKKYTLDGEKTIELKVKMSDAYGLLRGRVMDFATGRGLENVSVTMETPKKSFVEHTDSQGNFAFDIREEHRVKECSLRVKKEGYKTDEDVWYLGEGTPIKIRLKPN